MIRFLAYVFLSTAVHGGPWMGGPRPMAAPAVDAAQWELHQRLLALEPAVLRQSLAVSRMAQVTTEESYRRTRDAAAIFRSLAAALDKLSRRVRPVAPHCVDLKRLKKAQDYFDKVAEDVYQCTHSLSDVAATLEVEMTMKMVAARAQVMDIKQAMWFCQKYRPEVDEECLKRLVVEGLQVLGKLPERARVVEERARAEGAAAEHRLGRCLVAAISAAEERHLVETEAVRACYQRSQT